MSFGQEEKSRILVKEGRFDLQGLKLSGAGISLHLSGSVNLPLRTFSGVILRGRLDSALLRPFLTAAEISGQVDLQVQVSGDLGNPQLDGTLDAKNIVMRWPEYSFISGG